MKNSFLFITCILLGIGIQLNAQDLPLEFHYSVDSNRLIVGNTVTQGFYDETQIDTIYVQFDQTNYWTLLDQNYEDKIELMATVTHNGVVYDSVGVRFKGQTSYRRLGPNDDKKSFAITMDAFIDDQNIEGYEGLNLNNAYEDESHMREVLYLNAIRKHIYAAKGNYIHLYINGQDWGIYPNIQNLNKEHVKEWLLDKDATRWRAEATVTTGGPGNRFNAGKSTLNYLGDDTSTYIPNYTLKGTDQQYPWEDLMRACSLIDRTTTSADVDVLVEHFDLDQALWFLASEIIFTDDDGYVYKGGMDYYVYYDIATNRLIPIEYDGNSCMAQDKVTWSPFYKANDTDFPLMNVLMQVPEIRQRYLAHFRTMMETSFDTTYLMAQIDQYANLISARYAADPKKLYTVQEHTDEIANLKTFIRSRRTSLMANAELLEQGVAISGVGHYVNGTAWGKPSSSDSALVLATAASSLKAMNLYYGTGLSGSFVSREMYDDGQHGDGAAGDGQYGAYIPAQNGGQYIRYYVESVANNSAESRMYEPAGAEHDVYIYQVTVGTDANSDVVINELMPSNKLAYADPAGEYDDWIELYNNGNSAVDLTGYFLTDDLSEMLKWGFPSGTTIDAGAYLLVWCDDDETQSGLHANFKLSADGEQAYLINPERDIADQIVFGSAVTNFSYSRSPNGVGSFLWKHITPGVNNDNELSTEEVLLDGDSWKIFPNPANSSVGVLISESMRDELLSVYDLQGRLMTELALDQLSTNIDLSEWPGGMYLLRISNGESMRLVVRH